MSTAVAMAAVEHHAAQRATDDDGADDDVGLLKTMTTTTTTVLQDVTNEDDEDEDEEEDLGRIKRRARVVNDADEDEDGENDGATRGARRRLKRANGERVARENGDDGEDSDEYEEEDEELMLERRYADTGRLTDDEVDEGDDFESEREDAAEAYAGYSSDSSDGLPAMEEDPAPVSGRKKTKKQIKKERAALLKEQERMMEKAASRARLPGWNVIPERVPYTALIAKLRAAVAHLQPTPAPTPTVVTEAPEVPTTTVTGLQDSDDEEGNKNVKNDEKVLEIDLDEEEDDDEILKALLAKKANAAAVEHAVPTSAVVEGEKTVPEEEQEEHGDDSEDSEDSEDDLSEEEEMTEEERRMQRKMAKKFIKSQNQKTNVGGLFEDEAEMSEDGGHTDDDDGDDMADLDELVEGIDFVNEKEDERRAARRIAAHMRHEQEQDEREVEKIKEQVANGFKRKGEFDGPDGWQRKRGENGEESESDDMDYGPVIERPEELVEMSDDDDDALAWREQAARRRRLHEQGTQETLTQLPSAFEGVSQEISAAVLGRKNSNSIPVFDSQNTRDGIYDDFEFGRSNSMPMLQRTSSQHGAGSSMLERQPSKTFIGRQRQVPKSNNGPVLGHSGASRSYVFARTDSQSQWGGENDSAPTKFNELGRDDNARSNFGVSNTKSTAKDAPKKKQSLFSMIQAPSAADAAKSSKQDVQKAVKEALGQKN